MGEQGFGRASQEASSLRDYLRVVRRRKWIIAQAAVLVPVAALALSLLQTPKYQATAEVLLSRQNLALTLIGSTDPAASNPERLLQTQAEIAEVPAMAERVLRAAGLAGRNPSVFLQNSFVTPKKNADLLRMIVIDEDPSIAARLATAYATEFTAYRHELDTASLKAARGQVVNRIRELERRGERNTPIYADLIDKEQQLKTTEALQASNTLVVRKATSAYQVSPRPKRNTILGIALGLVLGLGLAFLWEALDTRVRTTEELNGELGLPLLARVPAPSRRLQDSKRLVMLEEPHSSDAEAFRLLRTNLEFFNLEQRAKTIMVTSAIAQEGKSTTIANLAVALARGGNKVILVDLDLRRPILDRFFGFRGRPGITDVALGRASLGDVTWFEGGDEQDGQAGGSLQVLTSGSAHIDPGEFVGSAELDRILVELKTRADIVLIDAPPLLAVSDAMTLTAKVDAVVVVTRLNVLRRQAVTELRRVLDASPAAKLGYVVTGADSEEGYGYGQRYGYGYGYAYGAPASRKGERS